MKRFLVVFLMMAAIGNAEPLTRGERDRALSHLHATRKMFLDSIAGLAKAQWRFKPASDAWSIAEIAEHIGLSEESISQLVFMKVMKSAPQTQHRTQEQKAKDRQVLEMFPDRSQKFQAPDFLRPRGKWDNQEMLAADFKKARDQMIAYVRDTRADLRSHFGEHPAIERLDAYQWILSMSAHAERHVKQIREVKAHDGFPAK